MPTVTNRNSEAVQRQIAALPAEDRRAVEEALNELERDSFTNKYPRENLSPKHKILGSKRKIKVAESRVEIIYEIDLGGHLVTIVSISRSWLKPILEIFKFYPDLQ
ncbi:MAG: hypothetical protein QOC96_3294 [Acidobacteriota bacterium]|jgi:mRNA-degrading endonuclease RelE of RelBE toxin-antitoxin system|nr:hypothetical protein [Acidobacteriota bacterium]